MLRLTEISHREVGRQGDELSALNKAAKNDCPLSTLAYVPQHPTVTNLHYHKTDK